ncbi:MAG TPA: signal peptidase II [Kofleriaceae bacterium]|nr:signal peptidase II [Kofleriaceae bacterium]
MTARRGVLVFAVILIATLAVDQGSKRWAHGLPVRPAGCVQPDEMVEARCTGIPQPVIDGYWDWELAYNSGVAFSRFASATGRLGMQVILSIIAAIALCGVTVLALRTAAGERWKRAAFALIAGGALGNLVDRLQDGAVTDFVRWRIHDHRWPIFNVADAALLVGVVLLMLDALWGNRRAAAR